MREFVRSKGIYGDGKLRLPKEGRVKDLLVILGALQRQEEESLLIEHCAEALIRSLGLSVSGTSQVVTNTIACS